jgi:hypothetical protein
MYEGLRGALQFIADIGYGYDGYEEVESLKGLIDEMREVALRGLREGEDFKVKYIEDGF